jgi:hypothetical protein
MSCHVLTDSQRLDNKLQKETIVGSSPLADWQVNLVVLNGQEFWMNNHQMKVLQNSYHIIFEGFAFQFPFTVPLCI